MLSSVFGSLLVFKNPLDSSVGSFSSKVLMASCGLMTEKEYKAEVAALELKLEKYSAQVMNKIEF